MLHHQRAQEEPVSVACRSALPGQLLGSGCPNTTLRSSTSTPSTSKCQRGAHHLANTNFSRGITNFIQF